MQTTMSDIHPLILCFTIILTTGAIASIGNQKANPYGGAIGLCFLVGVGYLLYKILMMEP